MSKIRVMVVDDSALMRKLISEILMKDHELEVVATAMDGLFALKKIPQFTPDVITLDLDMPRMDGLTTLRYIVNDYRVPVVLVSSLTTKGGDLTLEGLSIGAVDFVTKPQDAISAHLHEVAAELIEKVKVASRVAVQKIISADKHVPCINPSVSSRSNSSGTPVKKIVAIGISTGGPNAISYFLPKIPADFPAPILIVQHMPEGFTEMFANRLNQVTRLRVKEARDGDQLSRGTALIAPGNKHLKITKIGPHCIAVLSSSPPVNGHRPSVDVLFDSVSQEYGADSIGVIMTGMGEDGARGLGRIKDCGGHTLAQDEQSCVVYGMPKAAIEMGHVHEVVSLTALPGKLLALAEGRQVHAENDPKKSLNAKQA